MRVTLNVFSGRLNPVWSLPLRQTGELIDRLSVAAPLVARDHPPLLGFRGFTLDADLEDLMLRPDLPGRFTIPAPAAATAVETQSLAGEKASSVSAGDDERQRAAAQEISQWLLSTAPGTIDERAVEAADRSLRSEVALKTGEPAKGRKQSAKAAVKKSGSAAIMNAACEPFLTPVQDAFWNIPIRRFNNNCYNYATNFASNTMAQPGRRTGRMYTEFTCQNVSAAARSDGYLDACEGSVRVVALGIWPGFDFHWWRLHPGGFWAHKIGTSVVMHVDNSGRILGNGLNPSNCNAGPYTQFCGFFFGPLGLEVL